jgi:DNA repair protein REV1
MDRKKTLVVLDAILCGPCAVGHVLTHDCLLQETWFYMDLDPQVPSSNPSSDLFGSDDTDFLEALSNVVLPGDVQPSEYSLKRPRSPQPELTAQSRVLPPLSKADHDNPGPQLDQDIYGPSRFGQYGEYMRRKRAKLQIQNTHLEQDGVDEDTGSSSQIFRGLAIYVGFLPYLLSFSHDK